MKAIWHQETTIDQLNALGKNTLGERLGMEFTEIGPDYLVATMPVDERTKQPFGLLHGGASVALAETMGSVASYILANPELFIGVGLEINANHVKAVTKGKVKGICKPIHIGGRTHVWEIRIVNEQEELACISRFTCTIIPRNKIPL